MDNQQPTLPPYLLALEAAGKELDFDMPSESEVGALLRALIASKPGGNFLELGTGIGLSLAWMVDGMSADARIISIENDFVLLYVVRAAFANDPRVDCQFCNGEGWLDAYTGPAFDLVFADTWPGKYNHLNEALALVAPGGFYVIDDMTPQPNWPEGHAAKAATLLEDLASRPDFVSVPLAWATGVVVLVRVS